VDEKPSSRRKVAWPRAAALTLLGATLSAPVTARPGNHNPTVVHRVTVGAPAGAWPMQRGDGARSGRTNLLFPTTPVVIRRIPLFADLATGPVVDDREHLIVATRDGKLVEISPNGEVALSVTLDAPAALGPVLLGDGTRFIVTRDGVALGISRDGAVTFTTPLALPRGQALAEPLATSDGCAVAAIGARVTKLGPDGEIRGVTELDESVVAITETPRALFLSTETGRVFEWTPPQDARAVGSLGGKPTSEVVASSASRLLAVVRNNTLVELALPDGATTTLVSIAPDVVVDSVAVTPAGEARFTTRAGWLLGYAKSRETFRHSTTPPTTLPVFSNPDAMLPPLVDRAGSVAFVAPSAIVGVVGPSGDVHTATLSECGVAGALVPEGPRRLAAFCRSGFIALIGEAPSPASAPLRSERAKGPRFP